MKQRFECKNCHNKFKKLTKDNLCAECSLKENKQWSKEFQEDKKK
jgi:transposase-like protein